MIYHQYLRSLLFQTINRISYAHALHNDTTRHIHSWDVLDTWLDLVGALLFVQVLKGGVLRKALACVSYALLWPFFLIVRLRTLAVLKKTLKPFHVARYVLLHDIEMKPEQSKESNAG